MPWNAGATAAAEAPVQRLNVLALDPGVVIESTKFAGTPLDLRTTPPNSIGTLSNAADHSGVIEAVDQLESISVCDAVATDTAKFADCILPATSLPLLFEEGDS